ncbi:MAG TPA: S-layer homology domain-containing protein, partial [Candidatus Caenarcaniphilales bacterium]
MSRFSDRSSGSRLSLALGITAAAIAPFLSSAPSSAASVFSDTRGHWARPFIETLGQENVVSGFPDGTFKPDQPVTRAQFAAIVRQAFNENAVRQARGFKDIPVNHWASAAIKEAYETGFMTGYPNSLFQPNLEIPKVQVLVSLASGLRYTPTRPAATDLKAYTDAGEIPDYATNGVAATTEKNIVVNYPNVKFLNPNETATRGDVAAFIYQALVNEGEFKPIANVEEAAQYIVRGTSSGSTSNTTTNSNPTNQNPTNQNGELKVAQGTKLNVKYP